MVFPTISSDHRRLLAALTIPVVFSLTGCAASSGKARSGGSEISNTITQPNTVHYKLETFGRSPTPEELAVFRHLWEKDAPK